ncbi:alcohol dehydrogenase catalytic domain-containing protein [Streptomyces sp. DSM 41524]|uniref:2-deoxy-scyllo-inosamine dehydrogenase n=2 Tax=Streptomyces TaxID=1883 RepID=A0ABU7Q7W3_9ACTN|nr:alcohol dehydrogenase catalytic domain-containing protein [Streptomyces sp. DSM 41524]
MSGTSRTPEKAAEGDTMDRRVTVTADGDIVVEEVARVRPAAGEARVRTLLTGICGSDVHALRGEHPFISRPYHPGHEAVGVVAETGPGVTSVAEGDRVLLEPNLVCGTCRHCRSGRYNICGELRVIGCQTAGAMADGFTVRADRLHRVPDGLTDVQAVLVEPLATPVHAVRQAGDLTGAGVLVLGAGPIGLLTALAARAAGARTVIVTDPVAAKRDRAVRLGADAALAPGTPGLPELVRERLGGGADAVFDCVAVSASVTQAVRSVEKGGTVMVVGVPQGPLDVPLDLVQDREIAVRGSLMYVGEDMRAAMTLLGTGAVPADEFVTATFPLDRADEAFRAAGGPDQMKVLVSVG